MINEKETEIDQLVEDVTLGKILADSAPEIKNRDLNKKIASLAMYVMLNASLPKPHDMGEIIAKSLKCAYYLGTQA